MERSPDILALLMMMQNGADMAAEDGTPTFNVLPGRLDGILEEPPRLTSGGPVLYGFRQSWKEVHTRTKQPNSLDAFVQGKAAFFSAIPYADHQGAWPQRSISASQDSRRSKAIPS